MTRRNLSDELFAECLSLLVLLSSDLLSRNLVASLEAHPWRLNNRCRWRHPVLLLSRCIILDIELLLIPALQRLIGSSLADRLRSVFAFRVSSFQALSA
jgi:hypothetical protein